MFVQNRQIAHLIEKTMELDARVAELEARMEELMVRESAARKLDLLRAQERAARKKFSEGI